MSKQSTLDDSVLAGHEWHRSAAEAQGLDIEAYEALWDEMDVEERAAEEDAYGDAESADEDAAATQPGLVRRTQHQEEREFLAQRDAGFCVDEAADEYEEDAA
jgi:hypothetical protein